jgi:hypothetical protein
MIERLCQHVDRKVDETVTGKAGALVSKGVVGQPAGSE